MISIHTALVYKDIFDLSFFFLRREHLEDVPLDLIGDCGLSNQARQVKAKLS